MAEPSHQENQQKGVSALRKALEAKGVKVDEKALGEAVKQAHADVKLGCDQCANGWHW